MVATIAFGGKSSEIYGGHLTMCRGPRPSCAVLCADAGATVPAFGDLVITDTDSGYTLELNDCEVIKMFLTRNNESGKIYKHLVILDRRRLWENIVRHGEINRRLPDGTRDCNYEKNLKEIVEDLATEAGESSVYTTGIPEDVYPYVKYRGSPMYAIEEALRTYGGSLILRNDNQIGAVFRGTGTSMPSLAYAAEADYTQDRVKPTEVKVVCGDTWYQSRFLLEAVGIDYPSGEVKPLAELSYYVPPATSNDWPPLGFNYVTAAARPFANHSIYRWFRIKELAEGGLDIPGCDTTVNDIHQLLPLRERAVEVATLGSSSGCVVPGELYMTIRGQWWPYTEGPENTGECCVHPGNYRLLPDRGIVIFDYPVFKLNPTETSSGDFCVREPILYLDIAHRVRDEDTGEYERKEYTRAITDGEGAAVEIHVPWLFEASIQGYSDCDTPGSVTTNAADIEAEADKILDKWEDAYDASTIRSRKYLGIRPMNLTGNIAQIEYRVGMGLPSCTIISQGEETDSMEEPIESKLRRMYLHQLKVSGDNWEPLPAGY